MLFKLNRYQQRSIRIFIIYSVIFLMPNFEVFSRDSSNKYFISPSGNDANSGILPETAWKTITKVNSMNFEPGDQILFEGGQTFNGNLEFGYNATGNLDNYIQIGSYGSGRAIINATTGTGLSAIGSQYLRIQNLSFRGDGRKTGNTGNGLIFSFCSDIIIDSIDVNGFQHSGVTAINSGNNYRLTNIYAHENGFAGIFFSGFNKTSLSDIYLGHCISDNNPGDPTVLNNHSGSGILVFNSKNILIEYCKASNNGWDMPRKGNGPGGIWVAEVDNAIIQHCISHDNKTSPGGLDGLGFDLDGGTTNSIIQYCLSYNNYGAGFGIFQYSGATDWKNNTIRYCISENDGNVSAGSGVQFWNGTNKSYKFQGLEFYNNVVYNANGPALAFLDHLNSDFNFRNNIFISKNRSVTNGIANENFQGNCWYALSNKFYINSVMDFTEWALANNQEMLNGEVVGMFGNPQLIKPGNSSLTDPLFLKRIEDYKLNENSIAIDCGLYLDSLYHQLLKPSQFR